jgi:Prokaryotic Cytochrome C oxidase subunit IV
MTTNTFSFPRRATLVWIILVAATFATFWLGTDHPFSNISVRLASVLALGFAFVKVWLIGMDFMEIRQAPRALKVAFGVWVTVIGGGLLLLYAI